MKTFKPRESNYRKATVKHYKRENDLTSAGLRFLGAAKLPESIENWDIAYEVWMFVGQNSRLMIAPCTQYGTTYSKRIKKAVRWVTLKEYVEAAGKIVPEAAFIKSATERGKLPKFSAVETAQQHYLVCQHICSAKTKGGSNG